MKLAICLVAALLAGCATGPTPQKLEYDRYAAQNQPLAISGAIKWTAYYDGLYSRALAAGAPSYILQGYVTLIDAAQKLEAGKITDDGFQQARREFQVMAQQGLERDQRRAYAEHQQRQALGAAQMAAGAAMMRASQPQPYMLPVQPAPQYGSQPTYQAQRQAGQMAMWTGKSKIVQTVTYQSGWECEYQYNGQYFTRVFVGLSCPSSIQVQ